MSHSWLATRTAPRSHTLIYLAVLAALTAPATTRAHTSHVQTLAPVTTYGIGFKAEKLQSAKYRQPLLDTPQTVNIVSSAVLEQQGAQNLRDILSNVPGITFGSGEGGLGWGDMFTLRGLPAEQSLTVDSARSSALTTRTDIFNLEQVEVFKGTGSVESGVGASGGTVNMVTKTPSLQTRKTLTAALGTSDHRRATLDINHPLGDTSAVRLNAMRHHNDVAGRKHTDFDRWGIAPSIALGLGTHTRLVASYLHQRDINTPDFGVPVSNTTGKRMQGVGRHYWAGLSNVDTEETESNALMIRIEHDVNDRIRLRNQTRKAEVERYTLLNTGGRPLNATGAAGRGLQDIRVGRTDYWGYDSAGMETYPSGHLATQRLANYNRAYVAKTFANQTDMLFSFKTGGIAHQASAGVEHYEESYRNKPHRRMVPSTTQRWVYDVRNPDVHYNGPYAPANATNRSGAVVQNWAIYAHDHMTITPHWELAAGLRLDDFTAEWYDQRGKRLSQQQRDSLWSGRMGLVYKPVAHGSIYASYSQAAQPSAADAAAKNGRGGHAQIGHYSPGKAHTWEVGTKWEVFDQSLAVTASLFQVTRSNPTDVNPADPAERIQLAQKQRVRGLELGLAGNITPHWAVLGGLALMDGGRVLEDAAAPENVGGKLRNVPTANLTLWSSYALTPQWETGIGVQYMGKRRFASGNKVARGPYKGHDISAAAPDYWLANASLGYSMNKHLGFRLNLNNVFNTFYLQQLSASSDGFQLYGVPGAGRTLTLNAELQI